MNKHTFFSVYALLVSSILNASRPVEPFPAVVYKIFTEEQWDTLTTTQRPSDLVGCKGPAFIHTMHSSPYLGSSILFSDSLLAAQEVSNSKKGQHRVILLVQEQAQDFCNRTLSKPLVIVTIVTKCLRGKGEWKLFSEDPAYDKQYFYFYHDKKAPGALPVRSIQGYRKVLRAGDPIYFDKSLLQEAELLPDIDCPDGIPVHVELIDLENALREEQ